MRDQQLDEISNPDGAPSWGIVICDVDDDGNPVSVRHREGSFASDDEALAFVQAPSLPGPPGQAILDAQATYLEDLWERHHRACGLDEGDHFILFNDPDEADHAAIEETLPDDAAPSDVQAACDEYDEAWESDRTYIIELLLKEADRRQRETSRWNHVRASSIRRTDARTASTPRRADAGDRGPERTPSRAGRRVVRTTASGPPGREADDPPPPRPSRLERGRL